MTMIINNIADQVASPEAIRAAKLSARYENWAAADILRDAIEHEFIGSIALSSSFGADSAVMLHLVSQINSDLPVIFLDTDRHFFQTLQYRDQLAKILGLTNLINLKADKAEEQDFDPKGNLWKLAPDACCALRKVRPLNRITDDYTAWITGRKRHQAATRANMPIVEWDGRNFKVNPLANWTADDIADYIETHALPAHPLVEQGYPSIGCFTCTKPVEVGEDARAGRWAGQDKTECGIHKPIFGGDGI
ncbi:phosphoadenylyl-sulfate reductase [Asticcacaulis endophyticus]|nr:phosphoadenylyl-sulfate reductase [Asticcacaulis endophyticus]